MPKVKWIGRPKLDDMILGRAAKEEIPECKLAEMAGEHKATFSRHKKAGLLDNLSYNQVLALCKGLDISLDEFAATVPLPMEESRA